TEDLSQVGRTIQGHAHRPTLLSQRREDGLPDPPDAVGDELHALVWTELPGRRDQTYITLLDQSREAHAPVLVLFRYRDHKAQIRPHQRLHRLLVTAARAVAQLDLLRRRQQVVRADFLQVLIEAGLILLGDLCEAL